MLLNEMSRKERQFQGIACEIRGFPKTFISESHLVSQSFCVRGYGFEPVMIDKLRPEREFFEFDLTGCTISWINVTNSVFLNAEGVVLCERVCFCLLSTF